MRITRSEKEKFRLQIKQTKFTVFKQLYSETNIFAPGINKKIQKKTKLNR